MHDGRVRRVIGWGFDNPIHGWELTPGLQVEKRPGSSHDMAKRIVEAAFDVVRLRTEYGGPVCCTPDGVQTS